MRGSMRGLDEGMVLRCQRDRAFIIRLGSVILLLFPIVLAHRLISGGLGLTSFLAEFLTLTIIIILLIGVSSMRTYRRTSLLPFWKVMTVLALISFSTVVVSIPGGWLMDIKFNIGEIAIDLGQFAYQHSFLGFLLTLGLVWLLMTMLLLIGFGLMGVLASLQRATVPYVVKVVSDMSWDEDPWHYRLVAWLFMLPSVLEVETVIYSGSSGKDRFPIGAMWNAFVWELVFAAILAIYISLNPLILATESISESMGVAFAASVFVSLIVLPWSIYNIMDLRVASRPRDYVLYEGMKGRMTQVGFTLSTILILIKWGLDYVSVDEIIIPFIGYFLFNVLIATMFTFIYFNNVEGDITRFLLKVFRDREDLRMELINQ